MKKKEFLAKFPTRLLNINKIGGKDTKIKDIIETFKLKGTKNSLQPYAILSYVWGEKETSQKLSEGGKKSFSKSYQDVQASWNWLSLNRSIVY